MKNIWKWILGIVIVLVVGVGLVGLGFVAQRSMAANMAQRQAAFSARATAAAGAQNGTQAQGTPAPRTSQNGPMMGRGTFGQRGNDGRMPMMSGRGFGANGLRGGFMMMGPGGERFGMAGLILGGLGRLVLFGLFVLLLAGAYLLGQRSRSPRVVPVPVSAVPAATHACAKCGSPVLDGSGYCPSCGEKQ